MSTPKSTEFIRNFCIVAHIDHGKSTLADRLLEMTGTLDKRVLRDQTLDAMDLERERGITIKAKAVELTHTQPDGLYHLNLIDTPGHVDFHYEVSRSLAACEGVILLVDAAQGVEAQTVANATLAMAAGLRILPVINKVDLPTARVDAVRHEIEQVLAIPADEAIPVSAKTGYNVDALLEAILQRIPAPQGDVDAPLKALVFDAAFDDYRGVVVYVRLMHGRIRPRDRIRMLASGMIYEVLDLGKFKPEMTRAEILTAGEVGYLICNIKTLHDVKIGDTVAEAKSAVEPLPGYREPLPVVFCGLYPTFQTDYDALRKALEKLNLNDSSFTFQPETSDALGFGFRCGFLGLLHMEIVQERLERESGLALVQTAPNVTYEVRRTDGTTILIDSPAKLPPENEIEEIREPFAAVSLMAPATAIGALMRLCEDRRGTYRSTEYLEERILLRYELPLAEIIFDFYDRLKSMTRGYGTMDYEILGYRAGTLVKLRILVAGNEVDALSSIVHRDIAESYGRRLLQKLRNEIPKHLFEVALQAAIGGRIIARETIRALRKDVTAKCYGGDITRKRKLLEKQKEGKRRMKHVGNVEIPQEAFFAALRIERE